MKKIIAMLLALMLTFTGALALAEAPAPAPVNSGTTIEGQLTIDREAAKQYLAIFGMEESQIEIADAVLAVMAAAQEKLIFDNSGLEYVLSMNNDPVITAGAEMVDGNLKIGSSLFPSYALVVPAELIGQILKNIQSQSAASSSQAGAIPAELMTEMQGYLTEFLTNVTPAIQTSEAETGDFTPEVKAVFTDTTATFTDALSFSVDLKVIMEATKTLLNRLNENPTIKGYLENAAQATATTTGGAQSGKIDLAEIANNLPTENLPEVSGKIFIDSTSGAMAIMVDMVDQGAQEATATADMLIEGTSYTAVVNIPKNKLLLNLYGEMKDGELFGRVDINTSGFYFGFDSLIDIADLSNVAIVSDVYYMDEENPLVRADISVANGGSRTYVISDSSKTELSVDKLISGEESSSGLVMDLMISGLGGTLSKINEAVPEFSKITNAIGMGAEGGM